MSEALEDLARIAVDCGFKLHEALGPGLLEEGFHADLLVENTLLIELKSTEGHSAVHAKQVITYLRLMNLPLGLLMNFGASTFKEGVRRLVNYHDEPHQ